MATLPSFLTLSFCKEEQEGLMGKREQGKEEDEKEGLRGLGCSLAYHLMKTTSKSGGKLSGDLESGSASVRLERLVWQRPRVDLHRLLHRLVRRRRARPDQSLRLLPLFLFAPLRLVPSPPSAAAEGEGKANIRRWGCAPS